MTVVIAGMRRRWKVWRDVADYFGIPPMELEEFARIETWLALRGITPEVPSTLPKPKRLPRRVRVAGGVRQ